MSLLHARFGNAAVARALESARARDDEDRVGGPDDTALERPLTGRPAAPELAMPGSPMPTAAGAADALHYDAPFGETSPERSPLAETPATEPAERGVYRRTKVNGEEKAATEGRSKEEGTKAEGTEVEGTTETGTKVEGAKAEGAEVERAEVAGADEEKKEKEKKAAKGRGAAKKGKTEAAGAKAGGRPAGEAAAEAEEAAGEQADNTDAANAALAVMATGEPAAVLEGLSQMPASRAAEGMTAARQMSSKGFAELQDALAASPPEVMQPTGIPLKGAVPAEGEATPEKEKKPEQVSVRKGEQPRPDLRHEPSRAPLPVPPSIAAPIDAAPEESEELRVSATMALDAAPTTDPTVDTSPGPPPTVKLTDEANPSQMTEQTEKNRATFDGHTEQARLESAQDFGENDIYPTVTPERLRGSSQVTRRGAGTAKVGQPAGVTPEVAAAFDQNAPAQWRDELARSKDENARAEEQKAADEAAARESTAREIAALEKGTAANQRAMQAQAKRDVGAGREAWMADVGAADKIYTGKVRGLREEHGRTIENEKKKADAGARAEYLKAERDARAKKLQAERDAAEEKRKKRKSSGGFFGWVKRKVKSLVAAVKAAINKIFDALRKAVKVVIEAAKKVAFAIIDAARAVIIGAIRLFGKALELAADVFLAAFPEARAKAKAAIRKAVATAEDGVNAAADFLKEKVGEALDALGAALDFILAAYQKFYTTLLDVLEFIVVGLIEIMEGIARLVSAARTVPDHFWGQMSEEFLGMNVTEPLAFEKAEAAAPAEEKQMTVDAAVNAGVMNPADAAALSTSSVASTDVEVTHVAEANFSPEFLASIDVRPGLDVFVPLPPTSERPLDLIQEEASGVGASPAAETQPPFVEEATGPALAPAAPAEAGKATGSGDVDPRAMTPEQQLEYLKSQPMEHTCDKPKTEEPAKASAVPADSRIYGPFTTGQRLDYLMHQMKQGISHWWECNKGKVIAALVGVLLGAAVLTVVTGGAILAAVPPLMQIIGALLVGVALAHAAGYIGEYLSKAWDGDIQGGGKSLARGLAILLVELIFALLFNLGAVLKAVKGGLKGMAKAGKTAVKSAFKTTAKSVTQLRQVAVKSAAAVVKRGKLVFRGLRSGFEQGVKSLDDLAKRLSKHFRFKGFSIKLRGLKLELWGHFNPEIKLAEMKLTKEQVAGFFKNIQKAGESLPGKVRKQMIDLGKRVGAVKPTKPLDPDIVKEIEGLLEQFRPQIISENKIVAAAWHNALERVKNSKNFKHMFDAAGDIKPQFLKPEAADEMAKLYTEVGSRMRRSTLKSLAKQAEKQHGLKLERGLPEGVEIHHLLYKSKFPQHAVEMENLMLALRGPGGPPSELHELWHWLASGAAPARGAGSSFKELHPAVAKLIGKVRGL